MLEKLSSSFLNPPKALGYTLSKFEQQMRAERFSLILVHIVVAKARQPLNLRRESVQSAYKTSPAT
jgi:hypothetical protein